LAQTSKEAPYGNRSPPPRPTNQLVESATALPLEQLWTQLPAVQRQELLSQLTRIVAQRLTPLTQQEAADE